ncbi:DUF2157 domain-containing protein [Chrysosporum ovalisporum ANA283AFssAo]|uniref:DUF2157 domain-containing protein n=1 Tax=Umezakia ovalisporum TaxID=75695 RepID=UPI002473F5C3|nr:DUF2157 domain-containing protein [Umezakia ovalisporum]MDH6104234.1 DUF2157 domain-containing protein [Umezakia ovalisporum ANA283AFssAo]
MLDNFQQKLRQEAQLWRDEGLISASQYQNLEQRYGFNNLERAARDRFGVIVITIGSIFLCLGVITFVAANWRLWSREVKFILMMSLFFSTTIIGFYTQREAKSGNNQQNQQQKSKRIVGEGLLILSGFILGANILLMAQIFNVNGSLAELFFAWGFGVLVMAYSLSLSSLGIMAIILIQIGYWLGRREFSVFADDWNWVLLVVRHMPLLSWLLFVPLAYFCRSRWIFVLAAFVFATTLQLNLNPLPLLNFSNIAPWVASFAFALPPALFWSYDDLLFPTINYRLFQPLARNLALLFFALVFYALSFRWQWVASTLNSFAPNSTNNLFMSLPIIDLGILSGLAVLQWLSLLRLRNNPPRRELIFTIAVVGTFLAFIIITPFWHLAITRIDELGSFIFNVLLAFFASGLIREGLKLNSRSSFWGGMLLLMLQIISRAIEYDTDPLFQSLLFVLCGSALIGAGLWFERRSPARSHS